MENKYTFEIIKRQLQEMKCINPTREITLYDLIRIYHTLPEEEYYQNQIGKFFDYAYPVSIGWNIPKNALGIVLYCGKQYEFYFEQIEGQLSLIYGTPGPMNSQLMRILLTDAYEWLQKEWVRLAYENSKESVNVSINKGDFLISIQDQCQKMSVILNQTLPFHDPHIEPNSFGMECHFGKEITYKVKTSLASIYTLLDGKEEELLKQLIIPISTLPTYIQEQVMQKRRIGVLPKEKRIGTLSDFLKGKV